MSTVIEQSEGLLRLALIFSSDWYIIPFLADRLVMTRLICMVAEALDADMSGAAEQDDGSYSIDTVSRSSIVVF